MDYYSSQMSKLIEELSCLPGHRFKVSSKAGFSLDTHAPG